MKGKWLHRTIAGTMALLFALSAAACGAKPAEKPAESASEAAPAESVSQPESDDGTIRLPLVDEPVTIDFMIEDHATKPIEASAPIFAELAKRTNVHFNFIKTASGYEEKLKFTLASGNLPDMVLCPELDDALNYGPQGAFMKLNDLIKEKAPNVQRAIDESGIRQSITAYDGGIYAFPKVQSVSYGHAYMLRSDWMEKLGLEYPTNLQEYHDVLKAFKDQDASGTGKTIPLGIFGMKSLPRIAGTFNTSMKLDMKDGKVLYGPIQDEFKEMLIYLNQLYSEGLIDEEFATLSKKEWEGRVASGQVGAIIYNSERSDYFTTIFSESDPNAKMVGLPKPLAGPDGEIRVPVKPPVGEMIAVSSKSKNADLIAELFNYIYSEEGRLLLSYGIEGDSFDMVDGKPVFKEKMYETDAFAHYAIEGRIMACWPLPSLPGDMLKGTLRYDIIEMQKPYVQQMFTINNLTKEERSTISNYFTNINDIAEENILKFIMGQRSFDEWDNYVNEIKSQNIDEVIATYQAAYDRLNG